MKPFRKYCCISANKDLYNKDVLYLEFDVISHRYKCIFIHIPKCAGTSIENCFGHFEGYSGRGGQDHRSIRMIESPIPIMDILLSVKNIKEFVNRQIYRRRPILNKRNRYGVTTEQYKEYFKFTFVRNPWARAYSLYKNVIKDDFHLKRYDVSNSISFSEFLKKFAGKDMLRPQLHWIKRYDGSIPMDYIGRFENLSEDFQKICQKMNLNGVDLPHKLKGNTKNYRDSYDYNSINIISNIFKEEIELFDYTFER